MTSERSQVEAVQAKGLYAGILTSERPWIHVNAQMHDHAMTLAGAPAKRFYWDARTLVDTMAEVHAILRNVSRLQPAPTQAGADLYHTLVHRSPVAIFFADAEGRCVFVNQRFCEIAGLTPEEARGHGWMNRVHPDDVERVRNEWDESIETGKTFHSRQRIRPAEGLEVESSVPIDESA